MQDSVQAAVLGSFVADAFALGVHWVYDTDAIRRKYGEVETLLDPELAPFHAGKKSGDMTHYGDQAFIMLQSVAACGAFDADDFISRWEDLFADYRGYIDKATKETLVNIRSGALPTQSGSHSDELGGAARIAPLLLTCSDDAKAFSKAAWSQTRLTHDNAMVLEAAEFFAEVTAAVLAGETPAVAMQAAAAESGRYDAIRPLLHAGLKSDEPSATKAIAAFGQGCPIDGTLPSTVYLIAKHENDFRRAMIDNVMAGGDSATRGLLCGMVLGARLGMDALPKAWLGGMNRYREITALLEQIDPDKTA